MKKDLIDFFFILTTKWNWSFAVKMSMLTARSNPASSFRCERAVAIRSGMAYLDSQRMKSLVIPLSHLVTNGTISIMIFLG